MALEIQKLDRIVFDSTTGVFPQELPVNSRPFRARVQQAEVMLQGFHVEFRNGDHHVWREQIDLSVAGINANTVSIRARLGLRDSSGNVDDPYSGWIDAVIVADTAG